LEPVGGNGEPESETNAVICTCYMSNKYMYAILCCTKIEHVDKGHDMGAVSGASLILPGCHSVPRPFF